jgi:uncharacterized membrane protein (UPF0127 family)
LKQKTLQNIRKKLPITIAAVLAVAALLLPFVFFEAPVPKTGDSMAVDGKSFRLEVADTNKSRAQGLSGRAGLPPDQVMLFVFDEPSKQCMWMKDMQFAIDMVWLDAEKKVVHVERNVSPDTYPDSFCAKSPAKYVLEFSAGQAAALGITPGKTLQF